MMQQKVDLDFIHQRMILMKRMVAMVDAGRVLLMGIMVGMLAMLVHMVMMVEMVAHDGLV